MKLTRSEFSDSLSSFGNSVLGEFSWQKKLNSGLDLSGRKGSLSVVSDKLGSFEGDLVEDIVDERVEDVHGLLGNTGIGVDLLEDLVDVEGEGFVSSSSGFLVTGVVGLGGLSLSTFGGGSLLGRHVRCFVNLL
jgi:hypothetical protein